MDHIETKILNSYTIQKAAQNMVFAARLTQQGHCIQNMGDLMALYQKSFTDKTVDRIASLPHPTVQNYGDHRCDCRGKQTFSCTDHSSSKRSEIHECISAI